jgi:hypothetical protein
MHRKIVNECVEDLCQRGCREVTDIIRRLRAGEPVAGTEHLKQSELDAVLRELESIMAVYDDSCPVNVATAVSERRRRRRWTLVLIAGCILWFGIMVAASYWGYVNRDPVRISSSTLEDKER